MEPDRDHIVQPSSSIVKTVEWLAAVGFPRAWYLHGRHGSAVLFQEDYHSRPRIAAQGDKLLFRQENEADTRGYIVITQPEPDDAETGGVVRPSNMIDLPVGPDYPLPAIDHASDDPAPAPDGVAPHDPTLDIAVPAWFSGSVYIAGPMTGLPEFNYPAFVKAEHGLADAGYDVENPANNLAPENPTWANYMRVTIPQMLKCRGIALLPGWEESRGAKLEVQIALALGDFVVEPLEKWLA